MFLSGYFTFSGQFEILVLTKEQTKVQVSKKLDFKKPEFYKITVQKIDCQKIESQNVEQ